MQVPEVTPTKRFTLLIVQGPMAIRVLSAQISLVAPVQLHQLSPAPWHSFLKPTQIWKVAMSAVFSDLLPRRTIGRISVGSETVLVRTPKSFFVVPAWPVWNRPLGELQLRIWSYWRRQGRRSSTSMETVARPVHSPRSRRLGERANRSSKMLQCGLRV